MSIVKLKNFYANIKIIMTEKTRLIILLSCVVCFAIATPVLIAYSMGYRIDFETRKITATGGIYVRTNPVADQVTIDSKISQKPGIFSNAVFVQSLLPKSHTVSITKTGYYDYAKTLPVVEKEVTKIENVILFKKNILFGKITDENLSPFAKEIQKKFIIKNSNLYYSSLEENKNLTVAEKNTPVIKGVIAFEIFDNSIFWLSADGLFHKSDLTGLPAQSGKTDEKITSAPLKIVKNGLYQIFINGQDIFINNNGGLLKLNSETNNLGQFASGVDNVKFSPDGKSLVYWGNGKIFVYSFAEKTKGSLFSGGAVLDCFWLDNNYLIFTAGEKIIISEIDYRGDINSITLPNTLNLIDSGAVTLKSPKISYNQQSKKLYILTAGKTTLVSEQLIP